MLFRHGRVELSARAPAPIRREGLRRRTFSRRGDSHADRSQTTSSGRGDLRRCLRVRHNRRRRHRARNERGTRVPRLASVQRFGGAEPRGHRNPRGIHPPPRGGVDGDLHVVHLIAALLWFRPEMRIVKLLVLSFAILLPPVAVRPLTIASEKRWGVLTVQLALGTATLASALIVALVSLWPAKALPGSPAA